MAWSTPLSPSPSCSSKHYISRGMRPDSSTGNFPCAVCITRCIYCDIWELALFLFSRTSQPAKRPSSKPSTMAEYEWQLSEKAIEAQFQRERASLSSIISICTVDGAEESEGLRLAHERCLTSVIHLIHQERMLEDRAAKDRSRAPPHQQQNSRDMSWDCRLGESPYESRRPSMLGTAR